MPFVNPTPEQIADFSSSIPDDKPIVMVNLLRFRERAAYEPGASGNPDVTGHKAYDRYSKAVLPLLWEVGGQILWLGKARITFIGPADEGWDEVALAYYPSRGAFLRMVRSPAYQAIVHHRTAALVDSRLIETTIAALPRAVLALARGATRAKALLKPKIAR